MVTADKNWYGKGSTTGPLQPMQYYLSSSHISCSPQEALVAIPNTHKEEHQQGLHIPHQEVKLQSSCEAQWGALENPQFMCHSEESIPALSESIRRSSTPFSSPQMLAPLPPTKTTKSWHRHAQSPGKGTVVLEITGVFENKVVAVDHPPPTIYFRTFRIQCNSPCLGTLQKILHLQPLIRKLITFCSSP